MNRIEQIRDIILENNFLNTDAGERFRLIYDIKGIQAMISFAGRSKKHESYRLGIDSDSDVVFVTHLYVNTAGEVMMQLGYEDDDDFSALIHPSEARVSKCDDEVLYEWVNLLEW